MRTKIIAPFPMRPIPNPYYLEAVPGQIPLVRGSVRKRSSRHWKLEKIGETRPDSRFTGRVYNYVSYYFRCPWCHELKKSDTCVIYYENLGEGVDVLECLVCEKCSRHYWIRLADMRRFVIEAVRKRKKTAPRKRR